MGEVSARSNPFFFFFSLVRGSVGGVVSRLGGNGIIGRTGDSGGETSLGTGLRVETAGAPVSPLMSAPRLEDFLLGRDMPVVLVRNLKLDVVCPSGCTIKSGNFSRVCERDMGDVGREREIRGSRHSCEGEEDDDG